MKQGRISRLYLKPFSVVWSFLSFLSLAGTQPEMQCVEVCQRYPRNGIVDILVTIQGAADDVVKTECMFDAMNGATKAAIPVVHVTRNGDVSGSGGVWLLKFVWDAAADIGMVKIDDVALTVDAVIRRDSPDGVQLWESGPYWAECNVGAMKPEEHGHYFWWGDTVGYRFTGGQWRAVDGSVGVFTFSEDNCMTYLKSDSQLQAEGYLDASGNLAAAHDAATVCLGAPWRIPTNAEFDALKDNCTMTWTTRNDVPGTLVTGRGAYASKSIFLPAAGYGSELYRFYLGDNGYYWSSTPNSANSLKAFCLDVNSIVTFRVPSDREDGRSVRPVQSAVTVLPSVTTHFALDCREEESVMPTGGQQVEVSIIPVFRSAGVAGAFTAPAAKTLNGALVKDGKAFGVLQVKVGKASKTGESKVSVTVIGLGGKKYTSKAATVPTGDTVTKDFEVKKLGTLTLTFGANGFSGTLDGATVTSVDANSATTDGKATFAAGDLSSLSGVLTKYLPQDELVTRTEKKWKVAAKAGKLKYVKPNEKKGVAGGLEATGSNIAALKLTYTPKTQTFKGSFKVWTFDEAKKKLKSVSAKVTGVVVNGAGYGEVVVKKAKIGEIVVK